MTFIHSHHLTSPQRYNTAWAVKEGTATANDIIRCCFKRFLPSLDHNTEPSAEALVPVKDTDADPEESYHHLSAEELAAFKESILDRKKVFFFFLRILHHS